MNAAERTPLTEHTSAVGREHGVAVATAAVRASLTERASAVGAGRISTRHRPAPSCHVGPVRGRVCGATVVNAAGQAALAARVGPAVVFWWSRRDCPGASGVGGPVAGFGEMVVHGEVGL
ncbi:hypothetical protein GCM10009534_20320 [Kribbella sandramycini]